MDQSFPDLDESEQFFENAMEITQNMENENHELVENVIFVYFFKSPIETIF